MKTLIYLLLVLQFIGQNCLGQELSLNTIEKEISEVVANGHSVGISAGLIKGDALSHYASQGFTDLNRRDAFTENTITRIASISKPITATAIMQLVESQKLELDDSIDNFIPEIKNSKLRKVTVRQLLEQSSGIKAYKNKKEAQNTIHYDSHLDAAKVFIERKLLFEPGTGFRYSSYNYTLLALVIERASGYSYKEYVQRNIFDKVGMNSTSIEVKNNFPDGKSKIYDKGKKGFVEVNNSSLSDRVAGGGIQSTVRDILLFAKAIINNELISQESLDLLTLNSGMKTEGNPYGMGWFLYGESKNGPVIGHSGNQQGCSSFLFILPKVKVASVVLANTSGVENVVKIANDLFNVAGQLEK